MPIPLDVREVLIAQPGVDGVPDPYHVDSAIGREPAIAQAERAAVVHGAVHDGPVRE